MKKSICLFLTLIFLQCAYSQNNFPKINPDDIQIVRDTFGIPHIYAATDAQVAYGLAWANAEDAFKEMQDLLVIGKGKSGINQGIEGAKADFFRHVIKAEETAKEKMTDLPQDFLKYIDGYVQGINAFVAKHPERVVYKKIFPITAHDVLTAYIVSLSFMTDAAGAMQKIYDGKLDDIDLKGLGSNAYAINSKKSADGHTYLCTNPHMQMNGTFSFYEAHLNSDEGLNMYGAIFHGGTSVYMGNNEHLGWGMTWNYFNRGDIYKLKMHPKKKLQYEFEGEWFELEKRTAKLKVKVAGIPLSVRKKAYWSPQHGPVLNSSKNKKEFYAFRYPAFMDVKAPLQWYKMNKATSFSEFKNALEIFGVSMFNIVYADKEDNLYYVSYGQVPFRHDSIAEMKVVPGNQDKYVWKRLHELNELPNETNPDCNYIYNTNNTPFFATCDENNNLKIKLKKYLDERPGQNNRAAVLHNFLESNDKISFDDFEAIKFDNSYSEESYLMRELNPFFEIPKGKYEDVDDLLDLLKNWNKIADTNCVSSTVMMVVMDKIFKQKKYNDRQFVVDFEMTEQEFIEAMRESKKWFLEHYNTIEVPLGKVFLAKKGKETFASPGFPDALAANYGKKDGAKYYVEHGDTYSHFVKFDKNGVKEIRTLVPFGNSNVEGSPYYLNQAKLFQQQKTKKVSMDKKEIFDNAEKVYSPK